MEERRGNSRDAVAEWDILDAYELLMFGLDIVTDMSIDHEVVVITNRRRPVVRQGTMDRHALSKSVVITDDYAAAGLAGVVAQRLRGEAEAHKGVHRVSPTDGQWAAEMRAADKARAAADGDRAEAAIENAIRADSDRLGQIDITHDAGGGVNLGHGLQCNDKDTEVVRPDAQREAADTTFGDR